MHITIASMNANGEINRKVQTATNVADTIVLQTDIGTFFRDNQIAFTTLDEIYKSAEDFDDLTDKSCMVLMKDNLLFIVLGDVYSNQIASCLVQRINQDGGSVSVIPGGNTALCMAFEDGIVDIVQGVSMYTATAFQTAYDTDAVLVINEVDTRFKASELKLKLSKAYGDTHSAYIADIRGNKGKKIPLYLLDGEQSYGYYTSIVLPTCQLTDKERYTFSDLMSVMDILRSKNGCPWDKKQTHTSLKRYLLEESYEVIEAIDDDDMDALYDELGDVLLQIVFHAKIAQQHGEFDITDVTTAICQKMISRHTHIFGNAVADTPEDVVQNWEQIKKKEKGQQSQTDVLNSVPKSMPALMRSEKVQHKAAHVGFDFQHISEAMDKVTEELAEVAQDIHNEDKLVEECGDLLFSAVNVSRLVGVEPETALQRATDKFISRFALVEQIAEKQKVDMHTCGIDKLNDLWDQAKCKLAK